MRFIDRQDAGQRLAVRLGRFRGANTLVLGLPRGGVVVAAEVARALGMPLGVILVRKIEHPFYPEYAIGAVAEGAPPLYDEAEAMDVGQETLRRLETDARRLIERRRRLYYGEHAAPLDMMDRTVILVDDGMATGLTMQAAIRSARNRHAGQVVVAVPVASTESIAELEGVVDRIVVLDNPANFMGAVGAHYHRFEEVDDTQVAALLQEANENG